MADLFASGRIVDIILALVALEAAALFVWSRRGMGLTPVAVIGNLASGACLMLALRAALVGANWMIVAGFLAASFFAHLTDLCLRFREVQREAVRRRSQSSEPGTPAETGAFTARQQPRIVLS